MADPSDNIIVNDLFEHNDLLGRNPSLDCIPKHHPASFEKFLPKYDMYLNDRFIYHKTFSQIDSAYSARLNYVIAGTGVTLLLGLYFNNRIWPFNKIQRRWLRISSIILPIYIVSGFVISTFMFSKQLDMSSIYSENAKYKLFKRTGDYKHIIEMD